MLYRVLCTILYVCVVRCCLVIAFRQFSSVRVCASVCHCFVAVASSRRLRLFVVGVGNWWCRSRRVSLSCGVRLCAVRCAHTVPSWRHLQSDVCPRLRSNFINIRLFLLRHPTVYAVQIRRNVRSYNRRKQPQEPLRHHRRRVRRRAALVARCAYATSRHRLRRRRCPG